MDRFAWCSCLAVLGAALAGCPAADQSLVINEFMASNSSTLQDESGAFPDWIELHNPTSADIPLGGYALSDDPGEAGRQPLDPDTVVPAGGYTVLFADGDLDEGPAHLDFRLSAGGESVVLSLWDGVQADVVDQVSFGPQTTDVSMARVPDGTGEWELDSTPTPGAENG